MHSSRLRDHKREKPKKSKKDKKLSKLINNNSDSDTGNESEHELSHYMGDRVKLMKEVLKIIKPKKIRNMAPDCIKRMQSEEINSMLLEELLGISNKRLRYIFEGKHLDEESSTDEDQTIDVISLDDVSDDDFVIISDDEMDKTSKKKKRKKIKEEPKEKSKKIKKEKPEKEKGKTKYKEKGKEKTPSKEKGPIGEENLMSVLELLELQARARAIRSQLDLESKRKKEEQDRLEREAAEKARENGQEDDEIIIEVPKEVEIVITSSDSENEGKKRNKDKAGTSKETPSKTNTNSTVLANKVNENTSIQINDDSSQDHNDTLITNDKELAESETLLQKNRNGKEKVTGKETVNNRNKDSNDKEEGEVTDNETNENSGIHDLLRIPVPPESDQKSLNGNMDQNKTSSSDSSVSDSDSSDNLKVVMLRENKKKKRRAFVKSGSSHKIENSLTGNMEIKDSTSEINKNEDNQNTNDTVDDNVKNSNKTNQLVNEEANNKQQSDEELNTINDNEVFKGPANDSDPEQSGSKIETAIEKFLKTQPIPPDNAEELQKIDEEAKKKEEKEKRIKYLKNKLQSYKKDVEGESSVTILENIVITPPAVNNLRSRNKVAEDNDDLVINVDQDDLDCIICD